MKLITKFFKILLLSLFVLVVFIFMLFGEKDRDISQLKQKYAPLPSAFVAIDDMNVHYRDEGNPKDSLPIVLIHGTSSSLHTFDDWTASLKKNRRVLRMDLPGFGLTGPFSDGIHSIDKYVVFIDHFLASQGIKKCVLGGNSLGGNIAWQFTAENPEMVEKLILIDAVGYPLHSESVPIAFKVARIPVLNNILTVITPRFMIKSSVENVYADKTKITESLIDRYFELTLRAGNRQALISRMTIEVDTIEVSSIKNIRQPTLILWGAEDRLVPLDIAYRFQEDLPNDTLVILKNTGHVPMEESPKESLTAVLDFL